MSDVTPVRGGLLGQRYRLGEVIGRGGRGTVYAASDLRLGRDVAVKVFAPTAFGSAELKLHEAEARVISGLNHHALTTLFDAGIDSSQSDRPSVYLVMERVAGVDLKRRLRTAGPLSPVATASVGLDLASGLQHMHARGFLHRDIKPANVLIVDRHTLDRPGGKLADFGISSIIGVPDPGEYTTGTAAYLAPEQVAGLEPSEASDVYSLGLVLLEALTGRLAYPGTARESAFARLDRDPLIPVSVPKALAKVLQQMTALEPTARPPLTELVHDLYRASLHDLLQQERIDASLTDDEQGRLAAVRRYDLLETGADSGFDRITAMAGRILRTPLAVITVVDRDKVWFKARQGWGHTQVARDAAICTITDPGYGLWTVADTLEDERTRTHPLVTGSPYIRSLAAAPLTTHDGYALGALCVFDQEPRTFTDEDLTNLSDLAAVVMRELELRLASRRAAFTDDV